MKKLRLTIYVLFFTFNISLFVFALVIENVEIFKLASWILPKIPYMKYGALLGVILVIVDFIVDKVEKRILLNEIKKIEKELNSTKAKLYDLQPSAGASSNAGTSASQSEAQQGSQNN